MAKRVGQRLADLEAAQGTGDLADVDCTIVLTWGDDPEEKPVWECRNRKTGDPVEATPALRRAIAARDRGTPAAVVVDWGEDPA